MSDIQRYAIRPVRSYGLSAPTYLSVDENRKGEWCKYKDIKAHLKATEEKLEKAIEESEDIKCFACDDMIGMGYDYCGWCGKKLNK